MSSNKYEAICKELDTLSISYLNKLNEYSQQWKDTSEQFQHGYLDLAHAKYTMGARTISHYSYDERMKATLQVEIDEDNSIHPKVMPLPKPEPKVEKDEEKEGLRKRNVHGPEKKKNSEWVAVDETKKANINEDAQDIEMDEKKNNKKIRKSRDPLHWFGLFVSPSLRTSQDHFKTATEQLIHQVNRVHELQEMETKYQELQEEKMAISLHKMSLEQQQNEEKVIA